MKVPCEHCISLAICNVQIKQMTIPDVTRFAIDKKCERLQNYIQLYDTRAEHSVFNRGEINEARKLFKIPQLTSVRRKKW